MTDQNIPPDAVFTLLATKEAGENLTAVASLLAATTGALIGELHRQGAADLNPLVAWLLREAQAEGASPLIQQLAQVIAEQAQRAAGGNGTPEQTAEVEGTPSDASQ